MIDKEETYKNTVFVDDGKLEAQETNLSYTKMDGKLKGQPGLSGTKTSKVSSTTLNQQVLRKDKGDSADIDSIVNVSRKNFTQFFPVNNEVKVGG